MIRNEGAARGPTRSAAARLATLGALCSASFLAGGARASLEAQTPAAGAPAGSSGGSAAADPLVRGQALLARGEWAGALLALRPALASRGSDPMLHSALARAYSEMGEDAPAGSGAQRANFESALAHARRELELAPRSAQAHLDVAIAQGKIARVSGAGTKLKLAPVVAEEARRAIAIDPAAWQAYHVLGIWNREIATLGGFKKLGASLMGGLPKASLAEAIANLEQARRLAPGSIRNRLELARTYLEADRKADARAELRAALELPPAEPRDGALKREARADLAALR